MLAALARFTPTRTDETHAGSACTQLAFARRPLAAGGCVGPGSAALTGIAGVLGHQIVDNIYPSTRHGNSSPVYLPFEIAMGAMMLGVPLVPAGGLAMLCGHSIQKTADDNEAIVEALEHPGVHRGCGQGVGAGATPADRPAMEPAFAPGRAQPAPWQRGWRISACMSCFIRSRRAVSRALRWQSLFTGRAACSRTDAAIPTPQQEKSQARGPGFFRVMPDRLNAVRGAPSGGPGRLRCGAVRIPRAWRRARHCHGR